MDRPKLSPAQIAAIREHLPEFDERDLSSFADKFQAGIRAIAIRDGDTTATLLRRTLPQAFGLAKADRVTAEVAADQLGIDPGWALSIMQNAVAEAGALARDGERGS